VDRYNVLICGNSVAQQDVSDFTMVLKLRCELLKH
jgi:hypothetical protein